ncbi:MAG: 50S ribosomal protein L25/general stress protein Ctc [Neomegalonema sp.]|nr:50S ribosomal protein L25/general stress protein Ctc [Neomegalonema sp.]
MSEINTLPATPRERVGKGAARAARRDGDIPAVIYGGNQEPISINIRQNVLLKALKRGKFLSSLLDIELGDEKIRVVPRDVQRHVVKDMPMHVDFLRLSENSRINLFIPVEFINHSAAPGIKKGGMLNIVRHDVELKVRAGDIPEKLVCDLTGYNIGDSIHISAIKLPEGTSPVIADRDFTVATVAAPSGLAAGGDEEEEGGEE